MDNAVTQTVPTPLVPAAPGVAARWRALPARTQTLALLGLAALAVVLVALWAGARDGEWRVLFPNLSEKDGGQVIDRLTQLNVPYRFADGGAALLVPASRVHELRMKLAAAGLPSGGAGAAAGQHLAHDLVQVVQRGGLDAVERGDAHHDLVALAFPEQLEHGGRLVGLQVHQDRGHDLRVLVAHQFGYRSRVHPAQVVDAGHAAAGTDAVDQQRGLVLAQGTAQHAVHVGLVVGHQRAVVAGGLLQAVHHRVDAFARHRLHARDGLAQPLHLAGRQMFEDLGRLLLAQRHEQDGGALQSFVFLRCGHRGRSSAVSFRRVRR